MKECIYVSSAQYLGENGTCRAKVFITIIIVRMFKS